MGPLLEHARPIITDGRVSVVVLRTLCGNKRLDMILFLEG